MAQAPYLVSLTVTQPTAQLPSGSVRVVAAQGDSVGPLTIEIPGYTLGIEPMSAPAPAGQYIYEGSGIPPGATYTATIYDASPAHYPDVTQDFTVDPAPTGSAGCTDPRALNYDPTAGYDNTPSLCEFVRVGPLPLLAAAHLPIPFMLRASPTATGQASIVRLLLETGPGFNGPWQEFGRLAKRCDETASASFNLSESAKALLLNVPPPVETGTDSALTALLKVGYEVVDPQTLEVVSGGQAGIIRVVNAVVQPTEGKALTSPNPYATLPMGATRWYSILTYAGGVASTMQPLPTGPCSARQFAWLNADGGWDTGYFFGRHVHGTDQQDAVGYRDLAGADRYARRGTVRDTLQVYSDKVDWPTYRFLRGIRQSIQVYERVGAGQYVSVRVNAETFPEYQEQTDKTYQVNLIVSYPAQLIQTQ